MFRWLDPRIVRERASWTRMQTRMQTNALRRIGTRPYGDAADSALRPASRGRIMNTTTAAVQGER